MSNRNTIYADLLVDELIAAGVEHICLAAGSRNTPLVMAFAARQGITIHSHLDERSAAFFALGIGIATDKPAVLVCTSGSAAANFFPAIVEAHQSRVPMLVLTADRPHELRESGANQTIDQIDIYGKYALWSVDFPLPEVNPPDVVIRRWRSMAARAVAMTTGKRRGVVHLNLPFRKPLEPTPVASDQFEVAARQRADHAPFVRILQPQQHANLDSLLQRIQGYEKGMIVCGTRTIRGGNPHALEGIQRLAEFTGYPLLADAVSGVRFGYERSISSYETFMRRSNIEAPELIIRAGDLPTSKFLNQFMDSDAPQEILHLSEDGVWADDSHRVSEMMVLDFETLNDLPAQKRQTAYADYLHELDTRTWAALESQMDDDATFLDAAIVYDALKMLPENSTLLMGNSLPVRHLDQFGRASARDIFAYASRGASGIDGNLSTAFGLGAARQNHPIVAIVGDITFYHDMNGLLAARRCGIPMTIVVLNNNGGGIFHRLPVSAFEPEFERYFLTPHDLDFSHAAGLYGLTYHQPHTRLEFREAFASALAAPAATLIEVRSDSKADFEAWKQITRNAVQ